MAFKSPIIDVPYIPDEITPSATSTPPMKHKTHSKKDETHLKKHKARKIAKPKAATSSSNDSDSGTSTMTTTKKADAKPATAKAKTPKAKAPQLTRDHEHQAHIDKLSSLEASAKYWSNIGHQ